MKNAVILAMMIAILIAPSIATGMDEEDTILITGFEPFDKWNENPSQIIASSLNGSIIDNARVVSLILPVDFNMSFMMIKRAIEKYHPSVVMMLGLNGRSRSMQVEKVALNLKCNGWKCSRIKDGNLILISHAPAMEICSALRERGIKARPSIYAGIYSCNYVFYMTLDYEKNAMVSFIHLPPLKSQAWYGMDEKDMENGIALAAAICHQAYLSSRL